ncbi:MAG: hypothetical protein VST71_06080 [Nitrospirota bacterium]|nr:hypothetical protein [Nitrospirota bacterium]
MRKILWKIIGIALLTACLGSPVFAEGLKGWADLNNRTTKQFEDDKEISVNKTFYRNFYLRLDKSITPMLSYQLYFRTGLLDSDFTDPEGVTTTTYKRAVEPAIDLFLRNSIYDLSTGYRRQEQWSTAHLRDDSRETSEYYYSRLNIKPLELPSLSLQFDRKRDYTHFLINETDKTNSVYSGYSGSSIYQYSFKDLDLSYNLTYRHIVDETPTSILAKSIGDNFNGLYRIGYSRSFQEGSTRVTAVYQGNYVRNRRQQFVNQTGNVLFERTPFSGLYAIDTTIPIQQEVDILNDKPSLIDKDYQTSTGINIGSNGQVYNNIGIELLSSLEEVDRLYIYVDKDVSSDISLINPNNWKVYRNSVNQGTWTEIDIQSVVVSTDIANNIYRYEIRFSSAQSARYFKVINMFTSSLSDVMVTEIEAYGMDSIPDTGEITKVTRVFTQGLNLSVNLMPVKRLSLLFNYYIDRTDQNTVSLPDSISGIFVNIFSKSTAGDEEGLVSNITRTYSVTSTWLTHRLLTTIFRFQRNEAFDNKDEADISSNIYSLSFNSVPLPTLDTTLALIRSDRFSFGEKQSLNNSLLLSVGSRLYRDVNMITDMGYTESKSYTAGSHLTSRFIRGSLDAFLTRKLTGNLIYGFNRQSSDDTSSNSKEGGAIITYRPGRFINLSGSFRVSDIDGNTTTAEGILIDWLPVPVLKVNLNYQHARSEPEISTDDSLSGYGLWYITKFIDIRFTYNYTRSVREKKMETYIVGANLNCRF